jgi:hypothetical protein
VRSLHSIDVRRWAREGYLKRSYFGWQWMRDGEATGSIGVWVRDREIHLDYEKNDEPYRYVVRLDNTGCFLGGKRTWFRCPNLNCGRRAAKLYLGSRYFACRRCYGLAYQSQCYGWRDRALTQAGKLRKRLGGSEAIADPFPDKPPRMRWRTYDRLRSRYERYEAAYDAALWPFVERLLAGA